MAEEKAPPLGAEAEEVLALAELEARRLGAKEVEVRHAALALAAHPRWQGPFGELGIAPERLRALLLKDAPKATDALPQAKDLAEVMAAARKLVSPRDAAVTGGHILRAILEAEGPVALALAAESGVKLSDLINKPELLGLPERVGRVRGFFRRTWLGIKHLAYWTVLAFAWAAVWAFILYFAAGWVLGADRGRSWFPWIILAIGAACALGLAAQRIVRMLRRRSLARSPFAPRRANEPAKKAQQE